MSTRSFLALGALVLSAPGCREDAQSPVEPLATATEANVSPTATLAFWQVSTGYIHTCGVATDNRVYCWGGNRRGMLGDGTTNRHLNPVAVAGGLSFRQVSAGVWHTCGVTTDYRAYCWGYNHSGQLGDGTTVQRLRPVAVGGGHLFRQVIAGWWHTCGRSYPDNRAYCWGENGSGQLGDGTGGYTGEANIRRIPVAVAGGRVFRDLSAGGNHTCGVTTTDQGYCWGWNSYGQIGDSTDNSNVKVTPVLIAGDHAFRQVEAGMYHTCGLTTTSRAFCWGNGREGQLGNGKTYLSFWPRAVTGGLSFSRVTAGLRHSCGETTENRVYCWGNNFPNGEIGDGTIIDRLRPVAVAGGHLFQQVSAGHEYTCGKKASGVVYCWGWNEYGQFGDGTMITRLKPAPAAGTI